MYSNDGARGVRAVKLRDHRSRDDDSKLGNNPSGPEWRRWDENHGHVLWMGSLQEDWTNATIEGFFRHHGAKITVTRKVRDNYCFVTFASAEEAKKFMSRHNHQQLPGKVGDSARFNLKPRTRPRWFREVEQQGSNTGRVIGRTSGGQGHGKSNFRGPRDSYDCRNSRVGASHPDERGGGNRQHFHSAKAEAGFHQTHQQHQARGEAIAEPANRDYGRGGDGRGRVVRDERRAPRVTPGSQQRTISERDDGGLSRWNDSGASPGWRSRSRSRPRLRRTSPHRSRSRSPPPHYGGDRWHGSSGSGSGSGSGSSSSSSSSSSRAKDSSHLRRHHDPSFQQARQNSDGIPGGGDGRGDDRDSLWVPPTAAATPRDSSRNGRRLPRATEEAAEAADERSSALNHGSGAKRYGSARAEAGEVDGRYVGNPGIESRGGEDLGSSGQGGTANQGIAGEQRFRGGEQHEPAKLSTAIVGSEMTTQQSQQTESALQSSEIDQDTAFEEHPGWQDDSPPGTASVTKGCRDLAQGGRSSGRGNPTPGPGHQLPRPNGSRGISPKTNSGLVAQARSGHSGTRGIQDGPLNLDKVIGGGDDPLHRRNGEGNTEDALATIEAHARGAAEAVERHVGTQLSTSVLRDSSPWTASGRNTGQKNHARGSNREEESPTLNSTLGKESSRAGELRRSETRLPNARQRADIGPYAAPSTGSSPLLTSAAVTTRQHKPNDRGGSTASARKATAGSNNGHLNSDSTPNGSGGGDHSSVKKSRSGSRSTQSPPLTGPSAESEIEEAVVDGDEPHRRGTKRRNMTEVTLAQVIDHHMARRRLHEATCDRQGSLAEGRAPSGQHMANGDKLGGKNSCLDGKFPSAAGAAQGSRSDCSAVVAAAWANGSVLPLTEAAAPHMRLVAPLLAVEPEGQRIVVHTAAAVAAGAAMVCLPEHKVEVTGVCRDGFLLELHPKEGVPVGLQQERASETAVPPSALAGRLKATFDRLVALDVEFEAVRLPYGEAVSALGPSSSSVRLMQWMNDSTTSLLRLAPAPTPAHPPEGGESAVLIELRKALARPDGLPFLGIDCGLWPLMPRTGLLGSFSVGIQPVVLPTPEPRGGTSRAHRSTAVHLAVTLSDRCSPGLRSDARPTKSTGGSLSGAGGAFTSEGGAFDCPQPNGDAGRLGCVSPTCTAGGLTWRDITGFRCLAAVNMLALGPQEELDSKLQLTEGLHTAQIGALAMKVAVSGAVLVILAGRQGASADVVASRLCTELTIKGKIPAALDTRKYLRQAGGRTTPDMGNRSSVSDVPASPSHERLDSVALGKAVAALLGRARSQASSSGDANSGSRAAADGRSMAGSAAAAAALQWCDVVVIHGCQAMDVDNLSPGRLGLRPAQVVSVFVDLIPQVCVDNLTPINGADIRMLRALLATRKSPTTAAEAAAFASHGHSSLIDTESFLRRWFSVEASEDILCRSFRDGAGAHVNTALPYDLNVLKPMVEPLLRSVPPPTSGNGNAGDGCRSSAYALSRSVLRLLQLCETLRVPYVPGTSVLYGLVEPRP